MYDTEAVAQMSDFNCPFCCATKKMGPTSPYISTFKLITTFFLKITKSITFAPKDNLK